MPYAGAPHQVMHLKAVWQDLNLLNESLNDPAASFGQSQEAYVVVREEGRFRSRLKISAA